MSSADYCPVSLSLCVGVHVFCCLLCNLRSLIMGKQNENTSSIIIFSSIVRHPQTTLRRTLPGLPKQCSGAQKRFLDMPEVDWARVVLVLVPAFDVKWLPTGKTAYLVVPMKCSPGRGYLMTGRKGYYAF